VPFSMTWTVLGGAEWRLTLFAYSFYLIAAFWFVDWVARAARSRLAATPRPRVAIRRLVTPAITLVGIVAIAVVWWLAVPYALVQETFRYDGAATIAAGPRDRVFLVDGWGNLVVQGNVTMRIAAGPAAIVKILLPELRPWVLTLRVDPAAPSTETHQILRVSMNASHLGDLTLASNPDRIGEYEVRIPAGTFSPGVQRLELRSESGFKFWYVRIAPL
jgi:hypothetical protein